MERADFDAAVDTAGGDVLAAVLAKLKPRGAVAACGNAGGASFKTTVFPFILRGARLLGVDSVNSPPEERDEVWTRLDRDLDRGKLAATVTTVPLTDVPALAEDILAGKVREFGHFGGRQTGAVWPGSPELLRSFQTKEDKF